MTSPGPRQLTELALDGTSLLDLASQLWGQEDLPHVLESVVKVLAESLDLCACFVTLVEAQSDRATVAATYVRDRSPRIAMPNTPVKLGDYPIGQLAVKEGAPLQVLSIDDPRLTDADRTNMARAGCGASLILPLTTTGEVTALVAMSWSQERPTTSRDMGLAQALAGYASVAIQRARLGEVERERWAWLELLLQSLPAGVAAVDRERHVRFANAAASRMVGAGPPAPGEAHCYDTIEVRDEKGESICRERCPALECFRTRQSVHVPEAYMVRRDGQTIPVSITYVFTVLPSGEERAVSLIVDRGQQEAADELRDSLVSIVSHEFRTPLHHIKGFATSLLRPDVDWDEGTRREFLEGIDRETDRLTILVSNLLDLSRLEAGHQIFSQPSPCDPALLAQKALERARPFLQQHAVTTRLPSRVKPLWADSDQLERVLVNLLENAAKFSRPGQPIVLEVKNRRDGVEFHVRDRGRGIPPEEQARLFEKFSRAQSVAGIRGAGLGLAICKGFVERHGGRIWLARSAPGAGSDFAFWVPFGGASLQPGE